VQQKSHFREIQKSMDIKNLVRMANDIGNFFSAEPDHAAAVQGIVDHLKKFWDPRMRRLIIEHYLEGAVDMSDLVREAVGQLEKETVLLRSTGDG
jgi:formate dehydrogenase subunit delta